MEPGIRIRVNQYLRTYGYELTRGNLIVEFQSRNFYTYTRGDKRDFIELARAKGSRRAFRRLISSRYCRLKGIYLDA